MITAYMLGKNFGVVVVDGYMVRRSQAQHRCGYQYAVIRMNKNGTYPKRTVYKENYFLVSSIAKVNAIIA